MMMTIPAPLLLCFLILPICTDSTSGHLVSCDGWSLSRYPGLRKFVLEEAEWYRDLTVEFKKGHSPVLTVWNETTETIQLDTLGYTSKNHFHSLLQSKGFRKKRRNEIYNIMHKHEQIRQFQAKRKQVLQDFTRDRASWALRFRMDIMQDVSWYTREPTSGLKQPDLLVKNYDEIHNITHVRATGEAPLKMCER